MPLRQSKGNMYGFVTHTWNTVSGECFHGCTYCYMKAWGKQPDIHFNAKEMNTDLGTGNFIFVGSGNDLFAEQVTTLWINQTLNHCLKYPQNKYLFQTKNPQRLGAISFLDKLSKLDCVICTTIETNRYYPEIMQKAPRPFNRAVAMHELPHTFERMVTVEPIMDFDVDHMISTILLVDPEQVNIGADSKGHQLPEPTPEKITGLVKGLQLHGIRVHFKKNLRRLIDYTPLIEKYILTYKASGRKYVEQEFSTVEEAAKYLEQQPGDWLNVRTFSDIDSWMDKNTSIMVEVKRV